MPITKRQIRRLEDLAEKGTEKFVTPAAAAKRIGIGRARVYQMFELGLFTPVKKCIVGSKPRRLIHLDEVGRYCELVNQGLPEDRVSAGMRQHRIEAGRLKAK